MSKPGVNLLVFRDGRRAVRAESLRSALLDDLRSAEGNPSPPLFLSALLRAGELECGIADAAPEDAVVPFASCTDALAAVLAGDDPKSALPGPREAVASAPMPERLNISVPEGFAYYALHPLAYADAVKRLALPSNVMVLGIRSIGTTLSAVAGAAARRCGANVVRVTVRPEGHPYDRRMEFSRRILDEICSARLQRALFLVVDEGPGLSGSSLLSVAEALERAGVAKQEIILLAGHQPNPDSLCSRNAAVRWRRFRCVAAVGEPRRPADASIFAGAGQWRMELFHCPSQWPPAWTGMERLKYLSEIGKEGARFYKFCGLGHYGAEVLAREHLLADAGFGPAVRAETDGFVSYPLLRGRPAVAADLTGNLLERMAAYCAFRADAFSVPDGDARALRQMAEHNLQQFGRDLPAAPGIERTVIADGRMQPHEWFLTNEGTFLKTDGGTHGDDHFFPGATDIAWDLAGAIVEWRMDREQSRALLDAYHRKSGDDPWSRIGDFIPAYAVFRSAYCRMAAAAMAGTEEQGRMESAAEAYLSFLPTHSRQIARAL